MAESCKDLPDECWELIFNRLHLDHHSHLESSSLACKRFLSITNSLRTHFTIVDPTVSPLSKLFNRFHRLNSLHLGSFSGDDLDRVVIDIAVSNLNIESLDFSRTDRLPLESLKILGSRMNNLKVLVCTGLRTLRDIELLVIADSIPRLEYLDISYPINDCSLDSKFQARSPGEVGVTDSGIEVLSSKLKGLQKIDISGNEFLTDKSLLALSTNCVYLTEIVVLNCTLISSFGLSFVMRNSPNLSSVSVEEMKFDRLDEYSICCARNLSTLKIYDSVVPDEYLRLLAKAGNPLKSFTLSLCPSFTFYGISLLLDTYRSLEFLSLRQIDFLTDEKMSDLSQCLSSLVTIKLDMCYRLTESAFFVLAKNCPLLQDISMEGTNLGGGGDRAADIVKNPKIKSLNLQQNDSNLIDECLAKLALVCPSLEALDVSFCKGITGKGIANFLKCGSKIRNLQINNCGGIKKIENGFELSKLEVLGAARSGVNDDGLAAIGKTCCGLTNLNLDGCLQVTTAGVKEILTNCRRLREINLNECGYMSLRFVGWMVFQRPSLRKIILPYSSLPSISQRKLFLRHGCRVESVGVESELLTWMGQSERQRRFCRVTE